MSATGVLCLQVEVLLNMLLFIYVALLHHSL